jgi:hypothetical protein
MAQNVQELDISQTYRNLLFNDLTSTTQGIPVNLNVVSRRDEARIQDGSGKSSPLLISQTEVSLEVSPTYLDSVVRLQEVIDAATIAQNHSIVWS